MKLFKPTILHLLFLSFSLSLSARAQGSFPSANGLFTINYLKGCTGTEVVVTPSAATGTYFFCFDADLNDINSTANQNCFNEKGEESPPERYTFQYNAPGIYDILLFRQLSSSQEFDSITVEILDPKVPALSAVNCSGDIFFDLNTSEESFDFYTLDFGDGSTILEYPISSFPITHTYADNSVSYTVNLQARLDNTGFNNCLNNQTNFNIIPQDLIETNPTITKVEMLSGGSFQIDYQVNNYQNYYLQVKTGANGTFRNVTFINNTDMGSYTIENLDFGNNFYCVRLISESSCGNGSLISNQACSIFLALEAASNGNLIDWNATQFETSSVYRNDILIYEGEPLFLDENVLCGQADIYRIEVTDAAGLSYSSLDQSLTAIGGSPTLAIGNISTRIITSNELLLRWEAPEGVNPNSYIVYRKDALKDAYKVLDSTVINTYTDTQGNFSTQQFYYSIAYTNSCGGESVKSVDAPNILLQGEQFDSNLQLNWNNYTGYISGLQNYVVKQFDGNMNLMSSTDNGLSVDFNQDLSKADEQKYFFRIEAIAISGEISVSNTFEFKIPPFFTVPSAFSPNGDGRNEDLIVLGKFIESVELSVYNRWGTLLFRSTKLDVGWDGYLSDREAPSGTYTYTVEVVDQYGERYYKSGTVNLIR